MLTAQKYRELWLGLCYEPLQGKRPPTKKELKEIQQQLKEVETRTAEIKAGWSEEDRLKRAVGDGGHIPWTLPEYVTLEVPSYGPSHHRRRARTKIYKRLA